MSHHATYIVTGGAGFIGANLVAELLHRQPVAHVVVIDNFRSGSVENIMAACARRSVGAFAGTILPCSTAALDWDMVLERYEPSVVFHLGAITDTTLNDEAEMFRENLGGFERLLALVGESRRHGCPVRLVYASSAGTYGAPPQAATREPFPESAAGQPRNVYGMSKWLMEAAHRRAAERDEALPVIGLRYFNVFGPGEARKGAMASMIYKLARRLLDGQPPRLFADGSQARDQVAVADVVECTLAAGGLAGGLARPPKPGVYNVGSGRAVSFNQIVDCLREALGIPPDRLPTEYFEMPASVRAYYQDYTRADIAAAALGLGWSPRVAPLEAVAQYALWIRSQGRPVGERPV
ncbi:MAG: ADP-L-glycero-D-manno-heptose-6-epimerase [Phycisphaerae bacterium]|nr:MAG: ADP-L-glycero-D-manno-heptose-6-epimerase [Phycisphaerae bacterium]